MYVYMCMCVCVCIYVCTYVCRFDLDLYGTSSGIFYSKEEKGERHINGIIPKHFWCVSECMYCIVFVKSCMVWYGVFVWYGMVCWYGMVWCVCIVWYGVFVCYGMVYGMVYGIVWYVLPA